jgi:site-specific DNA-adenine methylase
VKVIAVPAGRGIEVRTKADLDRLAAFFGLGLDDLWSPQTEPSPRHDRTLIKWTGSKWRQAGEIVSRFPSEIATFYEPFLGGGAVFYELLRSGIPVKRFRCSDTCAPLVALWRLVQTDPQRVLSRYEELWEDHRRRGAALFYEVRDSFNLSQDPGEFFFLLRTCRNGVVRFDLKGRFSGLHNPTARASRPPRSTPC